MKRLEFLKRLGMGAAAVVAAPTIIANTKILPVKENIGEVLEFPDGTKGHYLERRPNRPTEARMYDVIEDRKGHQYLINEHRIDGLYATPITSIQPQETVRFNKNKHIILINSANENSNL